MIRLFITFVLLLLSFLSSEVHPARILCIYPIASVSHQVVFRALTYELATRGHELVVVTPDPVLPKERAPDNITEIDVNYLYNYQKHLLKDLGPVRGIIITPEILIQVSTLKLIIDYMKSILEDENFKRIVLDNKNQKFDLVIGEVMFNIPIMFSKIFDAPFIWFSSFYGHPDMYAALGAPAWHTTVYPFYMRGRLFNLSLWEKMYETFIDIRIRWNLGIVKAYEESLIKQYFGENAPSIDELQSKVDLMFVNSHPIFESNRPIPPNIIHLGALHMQPLKELPQELKAYLDKSKRGVIYVSLGTNVFFSAMDPTLIDVFLEAFEALPYDILWKFDGLHLAKNLTNVKIQKWFPQRDLLPHTNIKAFITQAGLQSTDEAIDSGVPLVALPALGDQYYNAELYVRLGIGLQLDLGKLKVDELVNAVTTVVNDKSYRQNVLKLRDIMRDQPEKSLDRAVWWTEYVIRHRGAKHLRSPAANMSMSEYWMLDVVFVLLAIILVAVAVLVTLVSLFLRFISPKKYKNKNTKKD